MYGMVTDGQPFDVFVRQEASDDVRLVIKFECKEGMGVLGIRKVDRVDPAPSAVYQEADVDPESLRAGRFVHVLGSGQRQSYALSRLTPEIAGRLPTDAWVELQPHTEYGFRYLVVPEEALKPATGAAAAVAAVAAPAARPAPVSLPDARAPQAAPSEGTSVPSPVAMAPALAEGALKGLSREDAVRHLREEMSKVATLQAEVSRLKNEVRKSHGREQDLVAMLGKWRDAEG